MIEAWIDDLAAVWAIEANNFRKVKSFNLVSDANFPESIDLAVLSDHPIALTFVPSLEPHYSAGGPKLAFWRGLTEIHLVPDFSKARIAQLLPWYRLIYAAAAGHAKLGGKVEYFIIPEEQGAIDLTSLQYGQEEKHWGMVINWVVKENVNNDITIGM